MRLDYSMGTYQLLSSVDQAHFGDRMPPDRGLADKKSAGVKGNKTRLTYAFTSNADGSEKLPPLIIGKANKPRAFRGKTGMQLGFYYRNNAKAWMTSSLYQEWIQGWDQELKAKNRKVLLLQDNFSAHIVPDNLQNIRIENFGPNLTAHVQPMDQGIIRCFKAHYRGKFIERAIDRYDTGITPSEIYDIDQLQAMRLADAAWREVDTTTIRHCWRKAVILPDMDSPVVAPPTVPISSLLNVEESGGQDPIVEAERRVEGALDELVSTGALQACNRMDISELLNPMNEEQIVDEVTDEEICRAVLDAQEAREEAAKNGGDDGLDDEATLEPYPTRCEVRKAASVINRYIDHVHDPVARKLEAVLASFGRQMRLEESHNKVDTLLTDYFTRT
jgi:hypothetical protein